MAGKVQEATPQSRIYPFCCEVLAAHCTDGTQGIPPASVLLRKIARKTRKVQRSEELEGEGVWEMGLGVASIKFPVGSALLPPFVSQQVRQLLRAAEA